MPETTRAEVLANVLAEHLPVTYYQTFPGCSCGVDLAGAWTAHAAAALDAALTEADS